MAADELSCASKARIARQSWLFALSLRSCTSQYDECSPQSHPSTLWRQSPRLAHRLGRRCCCWDESLLLGSVSRCGWVVLFRAGRADHPALFRERGRIRLGNRNRNRCAWRNRCLRWEDRGNWNPGEVRHRSHSHIHGHISAGLGQTPSLQSEAVPPRLWWGLRNRASVVTRHWAVRDTCPCVGSVLCCVHAELHVRRAAAISLRLGNRSASCAGGYGGSRSRQETRLQPLRTLN